jgi:hypothetical protein
MTHSNVITIEIDPDLITLAHYAATRAQHPSATIHLTQCQAGGLMSDWLRTCKATGEILPFSLAQPVEIIPDTTDRVMVKVEIKPADTRADLMLAIEREIFGELFEICEADLHHMASLMFTGDNARGARAIQQRMHVIGLPVRARRAEGGFTSGSGAGDSL